MVTIINSISKGPANTVKIIIVINIVFHRKNAHMRLEPIKTVCACVEISFFIYKAKNFWFIRGFILT